MTLEPWGQRVADPLVTPDVRSRIASSDKLLRHFGRWPTFEDAELVSLEFDRGNHMAVVDRGDWDARKPEALEATFYVFNAEVDPASSDRRPAYVSLTFSELHEVHVEGLNHQNPIQGLSICLERVDRLQVECFRVNWGGTCMRHEVSLLCRTIAVGPVRPIESNL